MSARPPIRLLGNPAGWPSGIRARVLKGRGAGCPGVSLRQTNASCRVRLRVRRAPPRPGDRRGGARRFSWDCRRGRRGGKGGPGFARGRHAKPSRPPRIPRSATRLPRLYDRKRTGWTLGIAIGRTAPRSARIFAASAGKAIAGRSAGAFLDDLALRNEGREHAHRCRLRNPELALDFGARFGAGGQHGYRTVFYASMR